MRDKIETYITYKWEERSLTFVGEIETKLNSIPHIRVIRDKNFIHYRDSIEKFMDELRQGDIVVMVLSDQYLYSLNCMYEMSGLFKDDTCVEKAFPVMVDTSIRDRKYYLELCSYWNKQLSELKGLIQNSEYEDAIIEPIRKDMRKVECIIKCIPRLFEYCRENNALDAETMRKDGYADFVSGITERAKELQVGTADITPDIDRLMLEVNQLIEQKFREIVNNRYKAECNKVEITGFDGQPQSANPTFVIDDTPTAIYAILHDLQKEVGEEEVMNIRYSSSKHRREYTSKTISEALMVMKYE